MDRRDFLRYFGAGAVVVPVIGGMPHSEAAARLIDPPKIQPVESSVKLATPADVVAATRPLSISVEIIQTKPEPARLAFDGSNGFTVWVDGSVIDVTALSPDRGCGGHWSTDMRRALPTPEECEFRITARYRRAPGKGRQ